MREQDASRIQDVGEPHSHPPHRHMLDNLNALLATGEGCHTALRGSV
jgi:hypothetical protein